MLDTRPGRLCRSPGLKVHMLDHVRIPELAGYTAAYSGIDHPQQCRGLKQFTDYAWPVEYCYNSRGFRDHEWPDQVCNAVWCLGDSFTAGVGSRLEHTWTKVLAKNSGRCTINVSMDGASNEWIVRRCLDIYRELAPKNIVIMWSYPHRRERAGGRSDLDRRIYHVNSTVQQDYENFMQCRQQVHNQCTGSNIVELVIPNWQPVLTQTGWQKMRDNTWPTQVSQLTMADQHIIQELTQLHGVDQYLLTQQLQHQGLVLHDLIEVPQLDLARDGHHFDIVTSDWISAQVIARLQ
jgi:hypothetical protein